MDEDRFEQGFMAVTHVVAVFPHLNDLVDHETTRRRNVLASAEEVQQLVGDGGFRAAGMRQSARKPQLGGSSTAPRCRYCGSNRCKRLVASHRTLASGVGSPTASSPATGTLQAAEPAQAADMQKAAGEGRGQSATGRNLNDDGI